MFRSKSKVEQVSEAASTQAHVAVDKAAEKAADLKSVAHDLIDRAAPHVAAARESAPQKVVEVADAVAPKVGQAKDTFVDDVLPKVAEAVATLAAGAATAKHVAGDTAHRAPEAYAVLRGESVAKKKSKKGRYLLLGIIALGAAAVAYKKSTEKQDPWATAGAYTPPSAGRQSSVADKVATAADAAKEKVAGAAEVVKDAADKAVAKSDDAAEKAKDAAAEKEAADADTTLSTAPGASTAAPIDPLDAPASGPSAEDGPLGDQPTTTVKPAPKDGPTV